MNRKQRLLQQKQRRLRQMQKKQLPQKPLHKNSPQPPQPKIHKQKGLRSSAKNKIHKPKHKISKSKHKNRRAKPKPRAPPKPRPKASYPNTVFMHFGLQRTGTNWLEITLQKNFGLHVKNNHQRNTVRHKHNYIHTDCKTLDKYDKKIFKQIGGNAQNPQTIKYFITIKHPHSWYLSFRNWQKKCRKAEFMQKGINPEYMDRYNKFYSQWFKFQKENPERVYIVKYETLLFSFNNELDNIKDKFNLKKISNGSSYQNTNKVPQSSRWNNKTKNFYLNDGWESKLNNKEREMLKQKVNVEFFGYKITNET